MRTLPSTPSVVPADRDVTVYIVLDDFGALGTAYREADEARCDQQSVIDDFLSGQFNNPIRVVAFNTAEGWARDASEDIVELVIEAALALSRLSQRICHKAREFVSNKRFANERHGPQNRYRGQCPRIGIAGDEDQTSGRRSHYRARRRNSVALPERDVH